MRPSTSLFAIAVVSAMTFASGVCSAQQSTQGAEKSSQGTSSSMEERQKDCNAQASAKNLVGDPRKAFMSDCLTGQATEGSGGSTAGTQQRLEQVCNTTASGRSLAGEELKSFMEQCLKGQGVAPTKRCGGAETRCADAAARRRFLCKRLVRRINA